MTDLSNNRLLRWLRRNWWTPTIVIGLLAGAAIVTVNQPEPATSSIQRVCVPAERFPDVQDDRYPEWPPAGDRLYEGELPFCANGAVALTCSEPGIWRQQFKMLVGTDMAPFDTRIESGWDSNRPGYCRSTWKLLDANIQILILTYEGHTENGVRVWTQSHTLYSHDGTYTLEAREGTREIAVMLFNFTDLPLGRRIKLGPNGNPAPPISIMA